MARERWNPPNPWLREALELDQPAPLDGLDVRLEEAKSALSENDSPDLPFRWSLNPYRGCQHACSYCYARPTHQYLGLGAGSDFERRLIVKSNLPEVLARELARPSWRGESISIAGVTDPYQPLEARWQITRRCLEVCLQYRNPVSIVTKGVLVTRDAELLAELARVAGARVFVSVPLLDAELARALEPGAPTPRERLAALSELARAGVPTGLALAPFVPRLSEEGLAELVAAAAEAGASSAFLVLLRVPAEVLEVFRHRLEERLPGRAAAILTALAEMRGGALQESRFGTRMRGVDPRFAAMQQLFRVLCLRHGLATAEREPLAILRAPAQPRQGELFP
ncbi:MAG: radical SAM protein [Planctomycetota bacterium]